MAQRVNFYNLFKVNADGSIEPLKVIRIGGVQFGPGVRFGQGVFFGNVELSQYIGRDFSIEVQNGVVIILGIF